MVKASAVLLLLASFAFPCAGAPVSIEKLDGRVRVLIGSEVFTDYVFTNTSRPYCYPIYGPGQVEMTRNWPMRDVPGEDKDHPHHRGLWYSHGSVNGVDFWSELPGAGRIVHHGFDAVEASGDVATLTARNDWVDTNGTIICSDTRTLRFSASKVKANSRILDFNITIRATQGDITFGDTKEGTMAIRVAESMKAKCGGQILNSERNRNAETWGKRASWCDYSGQTSGRTAGVAILDHYTNLRFPTWWHVRDYGLFAANPFGKHDFEKLKDKAAGNLQLRKGSSVTFRYRFVFHEGDAKAGEIQAEYSSYAAK